MDSYIHKTESRCLRLYLLGCSHFLQWGGRLLYGKSLCSCFARLFRCPNLKAPTMLLLLSVSWQFLESAAPVSAVLQRAGNQSLLLRAHKCNFSNYTNGSIRVIKALLCGLQHNSQHSSRCCFNLPPFSVFLIPSFRVGIRYYYKIHPFTGNFTQQQCYPRREINYYCKSFHICE